MSIEPTEVQKDVVLFDGLPQPPDLLGAVDIDRKSHDGDPFHGNGQIAVNRMP